MWYFESGSGELNIASKLYCRNILDVTQQAVPNGLLHTFRVI